MRTTPSRGRALLGLLTALSFALSSGAGAANDLVFSNNTSITVNDSSSSPYPSNIVVNNGSLSTVTRVRVVLKQLTHSFPDDMDIILVGPGGRRTMLMSDAGGANFGVSNVTLTFSSTAAAVLPDASAPATGTYRPANYDPVDDNFPAPGPGTLTSEPADLSVFNLTNPNGTWNLYVADDALGDVGQIAGGWELILTQPTVFTVNSTADTTDGTCNGANCTLREAIAAAQHDDLIVFSSVFDTPQTINLLTALPDISKSVTIVGPGAHLLTVRRDYNAASDFRIFNIPAGVANGVAISGMTISNGRLPVFEFGAGLQSRSNLTLTNVHMTGNQPTSFSGGGGVALVLADGVFTGCTFSGNQAAGSAGAIEFQGDGGRTLRLVNSTVSGNRVVSSSGEGGGIRHVTTSGNGRLEIVNSTITGNTAANGSGISTIIIGGAATATTTLRNRIVGGNSPNNLQTSGGAGATFQTLGFNLSDNFNGVFTPTTGDIISATPRLGPLSLGGGTTPTHGYRRHIRGALERGAFLVRRHDHLQEEDRHLVCRLRCGEGWDGVLPQDNAQRWQLGRLSHRLSARAEREV